MITKIAITIINIIIMLILLGWLYIYVCMANVLQITAYHPDPFTTAVKRLV